MSTNDTELVAKQAARLEEILGLVDTGVQARRRNTDEPYAVGLPGQVRQTRTIVDEVEDVLNAQREDQAYWAIKARLNRLAPHMFDADIKELAHDVVRVLFPPSALYVAKQRHY